MADVEDVNGIFAHGKKNSVFVLAATVEDFSDFRIEKLAFRRKRAAFRKSVQRENYLQQPVIPADGSL